MTGTIVRSTGDPISPTKEHFADELVQSMLAMYAQSARQQLHVIRLRVAGRPVTLHLAGDDLVSMILRPLRHLEAPDDGAPSTLEAFVADARLAPGLLPRVDRWPGDLRGNGEVVGLQGGIEAAADIANGVILSFESDRSRAMVCIRDPSSLPGHIRAAPLRPVFQWWAAAHTGQLAHAAAVGSNGRGVLLAGGGGAGKSTAAVACLQAGLEYAGDDYVLIDLEPPLRACSLYATAKLHWDNLRLRFPELAAEVQRDRCSEEEKAVLYLNELHPQSVRSELILEAILVPRLTVGRHSRLIPAPPGDALKALLPHTLFPLPGARERAFAALARLVRRVPAFTLEIGSELAEVPRLIRRLLAR